MYLVSSSQVLRTCLTLLEVKTRLGYYVAFFALNLFIQRTIYNLYHDGPPCRVAVEEMK